MLDDGWLVEQEGAKLATDHAAAEDVPATLGGLARHNVANALAAAAGRPGSGFTLAQVAPAWRDFRNSTDLMPGRLNLYRLGNRLVIVDYAHNVAGLDVSVDTAEALIGQRGKRRATLSVIIGSAGDRPDDYLRALASVAGSRADEVAIKEMHPLPARQDAGRASSASCATGLRAAGVDRCRRARLSRRGRRATRRADDAGRQAATDDDDASPRVLVACAIGCATRSTPCCLSLGRASPVERCRTRSPTCARSRPPTMNDGQQADRLPGRVVQRLELVAHSSQSAA